MKRSTLALAGRQAIKDLEGQENKLSKTAVKNIAQTHPDLLSRAAAFLLLKDSKASYTIEGETPPHNRIERWGRIIGEAGQRKLSITELEYLQQIVISDNRFINTGLRVEGGFVGKHDRASGVDRATHNRLNLGQRPKRFSAFGPCTLMH
ncbi:MAG: hypothetical protein OMM_10212 [Candidatus Magnetoglobus multicellularis str. Araruama]|uniref:Uncharacterized protein n=1 Tax=Candidatus Magnetoglobus multicellularis str. Araruama TaxID=890399 RepID=A0A1V1P1S6_9BACT|nr:MAG: hypothetical protein OMM_10212 [Candidatus Magnetoglobus multicellularis str. Araruama]